METPETSEAGAAAAKAEAEAEEEHFAGAKLRVDCSIRAPLAAAKERLGSLGSRESGAALFYIPRAADCSFRAPVIVWRRQASKKNGTNEEASARLCSAAARRPRSQSRRR